MENTTISSHLLYQALNGARPERVPCICPGGMMNMLTTEMMDRCGAAWPQAHVDAVTMAKLAAFPYEAQLFDNVGVPFCMTVEAEAMGARVDLGDLYTEPRVAEYAIGSVEDWEKLTAMDLTSGRSKVVLDALRLLAQSHPDAARIGNLIGERMFQEFSKPHFMDLLHGIKDITGTTPGIHICGKTKHFWKDLPDMGFPYFSVDNCEDLAELKAAIGDRMRISGNVPPTTVLQNGTIDDVIESVIECLVKGSDSPCGYSLAIGCAIPLGTPRENLEAYMYAARRYGRGAQKGKLCRGLYEEGIVR